MNCDFPPKSERLSDFSGMKSFYHKKNLAGIYFFKKLLTIAFNAGLLKNNVIYKTQDWALPSQCLLCQD